VSSARDRLAALQLPGTIQFGAVPREPVRRLLSGIEALDAQLGGGFPRGHLSEIVGRTSSGRTSLLHALLATATRAGEVAALIDLPDALDPNSLAAAGARLERVLWVRPPSLSLALKCAELVLGAGGFAVVALDLDAPRAAAGESRPRTGADDARAAWEEFGDPSSSPPPGPRASRPPHAAPQSAPRPRIARTTWPRLTQAARRAGAAAILLAPQRLAGGDAALVLTLTQRRAAWDAGLFEGLTAQIDVTRHRFAPAQRQLLLRLGERLAVFDGVSVATPQAESRGASARHGNRTLVRANRWERRRLVGRGGLRMIGG
jgi:hypothetical protein